MSSPRRVVPYRAHLITRRCMQRKLLLTPSRTVNHLMRYLLGLCTRRYGVRLLAAVVSTSHYHLVCEDPEGKLPDFMRDLDQLAARALNTAYGRGENLWCPGSYSNVELLDETSILDKLVYCWANVTKDGLIGRPDAWPGVITLPEDMGTLSRSVSRPETAFFGGRRPEGLEPTYETREERLRRYRGGRRKKRTPQPGRAAYQRKPSTLPEVATLEVSLPRAFAHLAPDEFRNLARAALEEELEAIYAEREAAGLRSFMGADRVRNQSPFESAGDVFPDFALDPRVAPGRDVEVAKERVEELRAWRHAYRLALEAWRQGRRGVRFPYGTFAMRVYHRARVEPRLGAPPPVLAA